VGEDGRFGEEGCGSGTVVGGRWVFVDAAGAAGSFVTGGTLAEQGDAVGRWDGVGWRAEVDVGGVARWRADEKGGGEEPLSLGFGGSLMGWFGRHFGEVVLKLEDGDNITGAL